MVFAIRELKRLWMKYQKKQHDFVVCKYDGDARRLRAVIEKNAVVVFARPYGITTRSRLQGFTRPSEFAFDVIRALKELIYAIHSTGYCLNGKLLIQNLLWMPNKKLKLSRLVMGTLKEWEPTGADNDYYAVHNLIRAELFKGHVVPGELEDFLKLLVNCPVQHEELIMDNIILLDDSRKITEYISCYQKLQQIQQVSKVIYKVALTHIQERFHWQQDVSLNSALKKVLRYNGGAAFIDKSANEGPLIYGRHCCNHLLDYSVDGATNEILFTMEDEFAMIEFSIPGLFGEIQRAVFEVTHITFPKELAALRAKKGGGAIHPK